MTFSEELKFTKTEELIEEVKKIEIYKLNDYALKNKEKIQFLYNNKLLDIDSIEKTLEQAVFKQARADYNLIIQNTKDPIYADHVMHPKYLAYALQNNQFSENEIKKILFDDNDTAETFQKDNYIDNLLFNLRSELFNPKDNPIFSCSYGNHDNIDFC